MSTLRRGLTVLLEEGSLSFLFKSSRFAWNKLSSLRSVYFNSAIAKMRGPIEYYGVLIPTQSDVFDHNVRSRFLRDSYETDEKKAIDKYFDNSYDLIDLGASTGFLTVYTIDQAEDSIRAVAIEANPDLIPLLEKTRNINNVDFDIDDSAYHSTKNEIEFYQHHLTVGGSIQRETEKSVSVSTINIKKAIKKYELTHPALIVDIEGGEADLLNNELEVLQNHCPLLLIEFHDGYSEGMDSAREKLNGSAFEKIDEINNTVVYKNNILN